MMMIDSAGVFKEVDNNKFIFFYSVLNAPAIFLTLRFLIVNSKRDD
jgi:hypothetical protein